MRGVLISILLTGALTFPAFAGDKRELETKEEKVSYSIGYDIGFGFKRQAIPIDLDLLLRGMKDALAGGDALLPEKERHETMTAFHTEQRAKMRATQKRDSVGNKKAGERFLSANRAKPGVVTLKSGLQYKVLAEGKGPRPTGTDTVKTHYRGTLINGAEFDSSYSKGKPASFPVKGVIRGWTEALQLMNVGSKWELYIPSDLAYGDRGGGPKIPPGSTLIFKIELLEIAAK